MNGLDIILICLVALAVFMAVRKIRKNKGGCSCGGGSCCNNCSGCPASQRRKCGME